jgi:hypothetical protein
MGKELGMVQDPEFAYRAALLRWHPNGFRSNPENYDKQNGSSHEHEPQK